MKPKPIGVIGGAGPSAGAFFLERLFSLARTRYGCHRDADFPEVFLISFPFSEMLDSRQNFATLQGELRDCLKQLRQNGAGIMAIACNTLHAFLGPREESRGLVHLPRVLGENLSQRDEAPLVLCTSTSAQLGLHQRFFPCVYPNSSIQTEVDEIIDQILKGGPSPSIKKRLKALINRQAANTVILGCTELSLFAAQLSLANKSIVDPLEILAGEVLKTSFKGDNNERNII